MDSLGHLGLRHLHLGQLEAPTTAMVHLGLLQLPLANQNPLEAWALPSADSDRLMFFA